jgi:hypothetical protein
MPILRKEIVPVGRFLASTPEGGRVWQDFTKEFVTQLVTTTNSMLNGGLKVPAPFGHKKTALPEVLKDAKTPPPFDNAGYWIQFAIEPNEQNKESLYGYVDVPGSDEDPNSPYYKAKNTAKEVSLSYKDSFQDGLGRVWNKGIMHVALVNHPIAPGQEEFKDVPDSSFVVNMSMMDKDDVSETQLLSQLREALSSSLELTLPSTANVSQFLRDLLVAVLQLKKPKDSSLLDIAPIYMSQLGEEMNLTLQQATAIVDSKVTNPASGKPYTLSDFGFQVTPGNVNIQELQMSIAEKDKTIATQSSLLKALSDTVKKNITDNISKRLEALKTKKLISEDQIKSQYEPKLAFEMSLSADGTIAPHPLETVLTALESVQADTTPAYNPRQSDPSDTTVNVDQLLKDLQRN